MKLKFHFVVNETRPMLDAPPQFSLSLPRDVKDSLSQREYLQRALAGRYAPLYV